MGKSTGAKIITSNHLIDGDSIYLTRAGTWSRRAAEAVLMPDATLAAAHLAAANRQSGIHVGAYLADATHFREAFRAAGPSNYFHGKQADKDV